MVISPDGLYTKHYYANSQRIISRIGDNDASIFESNSIGFRQESDDSKFDEKELKNSQKIDLQNYASKLKRGIVAFRDYQFLSLAQQEEASLADREEESDSIVAKIPPNTPPIYYYHSDHLGTSTSLTDYNGKAYQFFLNLPFGETMAQQLGSNYFNSPYKFNGKELDEETGFYYYGARYYDPKISIWMSVDPLAEKYPGISPYAYCLNNPINLVDPDGREPVPSYQRLNPWFTLKATQWYSTAGVYDSKTFNAAASYSTQHLRSNAFQSVYPRNSYYGWAQSQADAKGYNSKWFGAAQLVTGLRGVGGTEIPDGGLFSNSAVDKFLQGGNKFLFSGNMKNAKDLLADGKLSGGFTDANGAKQSFEGLTGMALDNKMVEFEQSNVQSYINSYKGNDLNSIISGINDLMSGSLGPGAVKDVMRDSFNGGKSFNFKSYEDRVKLGQELIKKAHNE